MNRRLLTVAVLVAVVGGGGALWALRPRVDPARALFATVLPNWQVARLHPPSTVERTPVDAAARWPSVARELANLDAAWPDAHRVSDSTTALNQALRQAGLPYWVDVQYVGDKPVVLTYEAAGRTRWRAGERTVEVLHARRLDALNIEMGLLGETEGTTPIVYLDRLEASLTTDLRLAYGPPAKLNGDETEQHGLAQVRRLIEAQPRGAVVARAAAAMLQRDQLVETMRGRVHRGLELDLPESLVYGEAFFERLEPYTNMARPGGALLFRSDVSDVREADVALRTPEIAAAFGAALELLAQTTAAHEARHALQPEAEIPPALLQAELRGGDPSFVGLADRELRAYLGELHDAPVPPCFSLVQAVRGTHGPHTRRTPHYFARRVLLTLIAGEPAPATPSALIDRVCALPDGEVRKRAADAWRKLYGKELVPARADQ